MYLLIIALIIVIIIALLFLWQKNIEGFFSWGTSGGSYRPNSYGRSYGRSSSDGYYGNGSVTSGFFGDITRGPAYQRNMDNSMGRNRGYGYGGDLSVITSLFGGGSSPVPAPAAPSDAPISMASLSTEPSAPSAAGPSAAGPSAAGPSSEGTSGPYTSGPSASGPSASGPSAAQTTRRPNLSLQTIGFAEDVFSAISDKEVASNYQEPVPDGFIYIARDMKKNSPERVVNVGSTDFNSNPCNSKSLITSDLKDGLCNQYASRPTILNNKCKLLSKAGCKLSSCCVSLDGNICVAGNANGPTFLTDSGGTIDYDYYLFKNNCYTADGEPCPAEKSSDYMKACGAYNASSQNVSKECVLQMAIDAGCPNKTPEWYTSLDMSMNKKSKIYIEDQIRSMIKTIKNAAVGSEGYIMCNGL